MSLSWFLSSFLIHRFKILQFLNSKSVNFTVLYLATGSVANNDDLLSYPDVRGRHSVFDSLQSLGFTGIHI
jgi:hypothetical protein